MRESKETPIEALEQLTRHLLAIQKHGHLDIHGCPCSFSLEEAILRAVDLKPMLQHLGQCQQFVEVKLAALIPPTPKQEAGK
jgi:hypothetical protein